MVYATSPSSTGSSTPVTVTVRGRFQFEVVKESVVGDTVPSLGSELESPRLTLDDGWLVSTTVKVALPPASVVVSPDTGSTAIPRASSSRFVTATFAGSTPL